MASDDILRKHLSTSASHGFTKEELELRKFYESLHKWVAHLTWQRVRKDKRYPQPYPDAMLEHGRAVLEEARLSVEDCLNNYNYELTSKNAKPYYNEFLELYARIAK